MVRMWDDFGKVAHHLAAVAHAQAQCVGAGEKGGEHIAQLGVEQNGFCPALARAQHITVAEPAARRQHLKIGKVGTPA